MTPPCPSLARFYRNVEQELSAEVEFRQNAAVSPSSGPRSSLPAANSGCERLQLIRKTTSVRSSWGSSGLPLNLSVAASTAAHICLDEVSGRTVRNVSAGAGSQTAQDSIGGKNENVLRLCRELQNLVIQVRKDAEWRAVNF